MPARCPICGREAELKRGPFRPFCSERCKLIDLDHWLSGRYRISTCAATPASEPEDFGEAAREELERGLR